MEQVTNLTHLPLTLREGLVLKAHETIYTDLRMNDRVKMLINTGVLKITPAHKNNIKHNPTAADEQSERDKSRRDKILKLRQKAMAKEQKETGTAKTSTEKVEEGRAQRSTSSTSSNSKGK